MTINIGDKVKIPQRADGIVYTVCNIGDVGILVRATVEGNMHAFVVDPSDLIRVDL